MKDRKRKVVKYPLSLCFLLFWSMGMKAIFSISCIREFLHWNLLLSLTPSHSLNFIFFFPSSHSIFVSVIPFTFHHPSSIPLKFLREEKFMLPHCSRALCAPSSILELFAVRRRRRYHHRSTVVLNDVIGPQL